MDSDSLPSPCISICQIDLQSGQCLGCYRSRDEIASWTRLSVLEQKAMLSALHERRAHATGTEPRRRRRAVARR